MQENLKGKKEDGTTYELSDQQHNAELKRQAFRKAFSQGMQYEHFKIRKAKVRTTWYLFGLITGYLPFVLHMNYLGRIFG